MNRSCVIIGFFSSKFLQYLAAINEDSLIVFDLQQESDV